MKRKILGFLGLLALPALLWAGAAGAQSFRSGDNVIVAPNEVVSRTLFAAGQSLDIAGEVDGDIFCAGQNIIISGNVSGDVICAGQTLRVSGNVEGDVRLAGQTITIGGQVGESVSVATQSFILQNGASVGRDVQVAAQDTSINGQVQRDIAVTSESVAITGSVGRDITATVDSLRLASKARVGGDINYSSQNMANIADGAVISGETSRREPSQQKTSRAARGEFFTLSFSFAIYAILSLLLVALAVVLLFPQALHETSRWALESPGKTILIGLLAMIIAPVVIISLFITLIGIPLALVLILLWLLVLALSGPFAAYYVGRLLFRGNPRSPIVTMLAGALALLVIYFIPFVGFLAYIVATWLGVGMILSELMRRTPKPEYNHHKKGAAEVATTKQTSTKKPAPSRKSKK